MNSEEKPISKQSVLILIGQNLPLISITIILVGYFNMHSYFSKFGIEIYNYVDTTELIFSFSNVFYAVTVLVTYVIYLFIQSLYLRKEKKIDPQPSKPEIKNTGARKTIIFLLLLIATGVVTFLSNRFPIIYLYFNELGLIILFFVIFAILAFNYKGKYDYAAFTTLSFFILFTYLYSRNHIRYANVVNGKPKYSVRLLNDSNESKNMMSNDSTKVYIGATRNHYFFYNRKDSVVSVCKNSDYNTVMIKELRTGL